MATFAELGIPFALFEAPSEDAVEYVGPGTCSLCGRDGQHRFELSIGGAAMVDCPGCGTVNGLDAADRQARPCRRCGAIVPFPAVSGDRVWVCYGCLRSGKAALTKDTELGMISWEQAFEGVTHGLPGLDRADFELVPTGDHWVGVRLPQDVMFELLRTPAYSSWQGERWLFCCQRPMVYLGDWRSREEFSRRSPDGDGRRFFEDIVQDSDPDLWENELGEDTGVYVFRCSLCERLAAHWDAA
jgi:uncharacterized protein CbrC (UPF0167 family)